MKLSPEHHRILLVRTDRIGDTLLTIPAVIALRQQFPDAFIAFLCQPYTEPMVQRISGINQVLTYEKEGKHKGWRGLELLSRELSSYRFDSTVVFFPCVSLIWALWRARIPRRIGTGFRWYSFLFTDRVMEHRKECLKHEADYNLNLLSNLLGKTKPVPKFDFNEDHELSDNWKKLQNQYGVGPNYAIVHAGSGKSAPNLSLDQYRFLIEKLLRKNKWQVLLTGSTAEAGINQHFMEKIPGDKIVNISGKLSLVQLMECIRNARLLITSSTGPLHLADAQNTPVLGFFCPLPPHTPVRWGPYQQKEWVVKPELDSPERCRMKNCPYGGCLQQLTYRQIEEAIDRRLAELK